jgi:hypothetical protein
MTEQQRKDDAVHRAGKILIDAFAKDIGGFYGSVTFNLQGNRESVHANVKHSVEVEFNESKQFNGQ